MSDLARLVEALFALRGFESETPAGGRVLLFRKEGERLAVRVRETKDPVPAFAARELADTLPALGHGVLVCLGDVGHEARAILESAAIDVWTRDKLVHEVGKAYLEAAERGALPRAVVPEAPGLEAAEPALVPAPEPVGAAPAPVAPAPTPAAPPAPSLWTRSPVPATPEALVAAPPAPPARALAPDTVRLLPPAAAPPPPGPPPSDVLRATVDGEQARRLGVGRLLRVESAALELVPFHAFRYRCRLEARGVPQAERSGIVAVDAVGGTARELPEPAFGTAPEPDERLSPLLPQLDASNLAKRKVVEVHTEKVRVQASLGRGAAIVEDRWVRPDPRSVELEAQGVWWLPVWRLAGQNGTMRINAVTGAVEEEKLKRAFHETAEFL